MEEREYVRLVKKAVRGNPEAYGKIIAELQEYLYKMAYLHIRNEEDASDAVAAAVLKGYQNIRSLKNPEWFKTWMTRILINEVKNAQKKMSRCGGADVDIHTIEAPAEYSGISPEERCDLMRAVEKLPERYRTAIILKYFSGLPVQEIAFIMGAPEGTVKAYLSRGRVELKMMLKEGYLYAD